MICFDDRQQQRKYFDHFLNNCLLSRLVIDVRPFNSRWAIGNREMISLRLALAKLTRYQSCDVDPTILDHF